MSLCTFTGVCRFRLNLKKVLLALVLIVFLCHFVFLPKFIGYYNDDCLLDEEKIEGLRHMVKTIAQIFEETNQTYWLDYGVLLGLWRGNDLLRHDGDVDISRLVTEHEHQFDKMFKKRLQDFGMSGNVIVVEYEVKTRLRSYHLQADLMRWTFCENDRQNLCRHAASFEEGLVTKFSRFLGWYHVPIVDVLPLKARQFAGQTVKVPRNVTNVLKRRYPYSFGFSLSYKWKCWLSNLR